MALKAEILHRFRLTQTFLQFTFVSMTLIKDLCQKSIFFQQIDLPRWLGSLSLPWSLWAGKRRTMNSTKNDFFLLGFWPRWIRFGWVLRKKNSLAREYSRLGTGFPSKPNSFAQQSTALEEAKRDEHKLSSAEQPPVSVQLCFKLAGKGQCQSNRFITKSASIEM